MKKNLSFFAVAFITGLYTAFVAMCMWNWFAVRVFNLSNVSYLEMLGLIWFIHLLNHKPDFDGRKLKALLPVLDACVPEEKRETLSVALQEHQDNLWVDMVEMISGQIIGNTLTLIFGFLLSLFIG